MEQNLTKNLAVFWDEFGARTAYTNREEKHKISKILKMYQPLQVAMEDEWEDDIMMVEVYKCKASLLPYLDELKDYHVLARRDNYALISGGAKKIFLGLLKELVTYMKDNTDKPMKVRNVITETIAGLDKIPVWGLILQILTLQGLCRWLEGVNINKGDSGFEEVQAQQDWINSFVDERVELFADLSLSDIERFKPLVLYLSHRSKTDLLCTNKNDYGTEPNINPDSTQGQGVQ